ncbi:MAG TPA: hypothetical protein VK524_10175, partial [Polyangiaceae bacterium]|nr:hypothetical protein [Polyangiaceae bacterium]
MLVGAFVLARAGETKPIAKTAAQSAAPAVHTARYRSNSTADDVTAPGFQRLYDTHFTSVIHGDSTLTITGSALLALTSLGTEKGRTLVHGQLSEVSLVSDNDDGADGKHFEDSVRLPLTRPFLLTVSGTGHIESLAVDPASRGFSRNVMRMLVAALQFVEPPGQGNAREWKTVESDHNGTYQARYTRTAPDHFKKEKLAYTYLELLEKLQATGASAQTVVRAQASIERAPSGVISKLESHEALKVPMGEQGFAVDSDMRFALRQTRIAAIPALDRSALVSAPIFSTDAEIARSAKQELEHKRKLAAGTSVQDLVQQLSKIPGTAQNHDARWDLIERMSALFDTEPTTIEAARLALSKGLPKAEKEALLAALSNATSPEAQAALTDIAGDA